MKVSLVMAVYNGEKYLIEQLDSIRKQSRKLDEVLLLDDGSTDQSYQMIHQYIQDYHLDHWTLEKNKENLGYRKNFKKGLSKVSGDILFLSDQDDRWHENKVEMMCHYMEDKKVLSLASSFNFMDEQGKIFTVPLEKGKSNNNLLYLKVTQKLTEIPFNSLLRTNFSQGCTMAIKKELAERFICQETDQMPHDWALNMMASLDHGCYYLDEPLMDYRIHGNNTIGLDEIIEQDKSKERTSRVKQRIHFNESEKQNVAFALTLPLSKNQKELAKRRYNYLTSRNNYIKNKKIFSLILYFIKGNYKEFGEFKTFVGDLLSIIR